MIFVTVKQFLETFEFMEKLSLLMVSRVHFLDDIVETRSLPVRDFSFCSEFSLGVEIFTSIFVAISAFCNAGFDIGSTSLVAFQTDPLINLVLAALIIWWSRVYGLV